MIVSFKCQDTAALAKGQKVRRFSSFEDVARRKLRQLEIARCLDDLRVPPGNHLEALLGDRAGQHSIRINARMRICFIWTDGGVAEVQREDADLLHLD